jgi:hypothetical protein
LYLFFLVLGKDPWKANSETSGVVFGDNTVLVYVTLSL